MTSKGSRTAIGSPASADGRSPCGSPGGPTTPPCGPQAVPVSRFRARDAKVPLSTDDTSGPLFSVSSSSFTLQSCLESKLRDRLGRNGRAEFELTWNASDMPAGLPICRLQASARPTYAAAYGGPPPTLLARDHRSGYTPELIARRKQSTRGVPLNEFMARALGRSGKISPVLACLWMGYPVAWVRSAGLAMPSSPRPAPPLSPPPMTP